MTTKKSKELTTKKSTDVTVGDYGDYAGAGFEEVRPEDLSIPFMGILQSNSPQVEDNEPEGAKAGMFFNTVTKELTSGEEGFVFLPVHKDMAFVEWVPRDSGGGFVGIHGPDSDPVVAAIENNGGQRVGKLKYGDNDLVETHYVYGLLLDKTGSQSVGFALMSFKSTGIKPVRDWFTSMYTLKGKPPLFANRALIKTTKQKNDKGTFYNFRIEPLFANNWTASLINPNTEKELLEEATEFRSMVLNGMAKADFSQERATGDSEASSEEAPF